MTASHPTPTIRRATFADAPALAAFAAHAFSDTFGADNRAEDLAAHIVTSYGPELQGREISDPRVVTLLAEVAGALAGFAQVRRGKAPPCVDEPASVELQRFYVDRPWHGRGVAHHLMDAVHGAANELGGATVWLGVWERNPRAIAFYDKCGFRDVGSADFYVGSDRQTDRVMLATVRVRPVGGAE